MEAQKISWDASGDVILASKDEQEGDLGGPREPTKGLWEAKRGPDCERVHPPITLLVVRGRGWGRGKPLPEGRREERRELGF